MLAHSHVCAVLLCKSKNICCVLTYQIRKLGFAAPAVPVAKSSKAPKATSVAQMLVQALHSGDNALLEEVCLLLIVIVVQVSQAFMFYLSIYTCL